MTRYDHTRFREYPPDRMRRFIDAVKLHALDNYEKDGWDYIVETFTDDDIAEVIGPRVRTEAGAIRKVKEYIAPRAAYRAEVQATADW
jgi:hypothetical protein